MSKIKTLDIELLEQSANMLRALAHPQRIEILNLLQQSEKLTVGEIQVNLNLTQSSTSHHLGVLKDKGILNSKRHGKKIYYELKHKKLSQIINCIMSCATDE